MEAWEGLRARHPSERATLMRLGKRVRDEGLWLSLAEGRASRGDRIGESMALLAASQCARMPPGWWRSRSVLEGGDEAFPLEAVHLWGELAIVRQGSVRVWLPGWSLWRAVEEGSLGDRPPLALEAAEAFHASQEALWHAWRAIAPPVGLEAAGALPGAAMRSLPWIDGERIESSADGWLCLRC